MKLNEIGNFVVSPKVSKFHRTLQNTKVLAKLAQESSSVLQVKSSNSKWVLVLIAWLGWEVTGRNFLIKIIP